MLERPMKLVSYRFDQLADQINKRVMPDEADVDRYVGLEHLDPDSLRIRRWGDTSDVESTKLLFQPGDIIFGKRRVYQRKVAVADFEGICSAHAMVLRAKPETVLPEFLPFFMQSDLFMERALSISVGSLSPTINWKALAKEEFLLPPIQEQARLAEAHLAARDAAEALDELSQTARNAFSSLLKTIADTTPSTKIGSLVDQGTIEPPQDGNHGEKHPKARDYVDTGIPFVMASDLHNGRVDFEHCKKLDKTLSDTLRIGFAKQGDVLLSHKGTVGEVAKLEAIDTEYVMLTPQVTYYRIKDVSLLDANWLFFMFQSPTFQMQLVRHGRQSTRAFVGITAQRELEVPFCDLDEQRAQLAKLRNMEQAISAAEQRKAILAKIQKKMLNESFGA